MTQTDTDEPEIGVWSRLFSKTKSENKTKKMENISTDSEKFENCTVVSNSSDDPLYSIPAKYQNQVTGTAIVQLEDGTLVALPYTGINQPDENELRSRLSSMTNLSSIDINEHITHHNDAVSKISAATGQIKLIKVIPNTKGLKAMGLSSKTVSLNSSKKRQKPKPSLSLADSQVKFDSTTNLYPSVSPSSNKTKIVKSNKQQFYSLPSKSQKKLSLVSQANNLNLSSDTEVVNSLPENYQILDSQIYMKNSSESSAEIQKPKRKTKKSGRTVSNQKFQSQRRGNNELIRSKTENECIYANTANLWAVPDATTSRTKSIQTPCYYEIYDDPNRLKNSMKKIDKLEKGDVSVLQKSDKEVIEAMEDYEIQCSSEMTTNMTTEMKQLLDEKNRAIRDGKIRHNQKLSTAKAKIHYLAGRVKEQMELLDEKEEQIKKHQLKIDEWKKREATAKSKVIKLEKQLKAKDGSTESADQMSDFQKQYEELLNEKEKSDVQNKEKMEQTSKKVQQLIVQIKCMETSVNTIQSENLDMKTRERQLAQTILELRQENARLMGVSNQPKQIITTIMEEDSNEESENYGTTDFNRKDLESSSEGHGSEEFSEENYDMKSMRSMGLSNMTDLKLAATGSINDSDVIDYCI